MNARTRQLCTAAGIAVLLGTGMVIYAVRGPAILLDLHAMGRFLCL